MLYSRLVPAVAAVVALAVEVIGFFRGGVTLLAVTVLLALPCVLVIARVSLAGVAYGTTVLAALTLPWNGVQGGPVRLGDVLVLLALVLWVVVEANTRPPRMPGWVWQLVVAILLVALAHEVMPPDTKYLANRTFIASNGQRLTESLESNSVVAVKFVIAVLFIPVVFAYAARHRRGAVRMLATAFAAGASISGLVGFADGQGLLPALGTKVTGRVMLHTREAGFSLHPNFLASSCALSVGIAVWLIAHDPFRRARRLGIAMLPGLLLGTYASGSRGGAVAAVLGLLGIVLLTRKFRPRLPALAFGGLLAVVAAFVAIPSFGAAVLKATRLGGDVSSTTSGSDFVRSILARQGLEDFQHSPVYGIGLQVAADAQNVYLQELASGGAILFVGMQLFFLGALRQAWRLRGADHLADALVTAILVAAVLNFAEASLTDRFFYVPFAVLVALAQAQRTDVVARTAPTAVPTPVGAAPPRPVPVT